MGKLDRSLWQWSIRRPGTLEWRIVGRCLTEMEARQWALTNGYEIRREAEVEGAVRGPDGGSPASTGGSRPADSVL